MENNLYHFTIFFSVLVGHSGAQWLSELCPGCFSVETVWGWAYGTHAELWLLLDVGVVTAIIFWHYLIIFLRCVSACKIAGISCRSCSWGRRNRTWQITIELARGWAGCEPVYGWSMPANSQKILKNYVLAQAYPRQETEQQTKAVHHHVCRLNFEFISRILLHRYSWYWLSTDGKFYPPLEIFKVQFNRFHRHKEYIKFRVSPRQAAHN